MLAVCDADLLGKTLKEGEIVFSINEDFYKGFKTNIDEALNLIDQCTIANLVGHDIVTEAIEKGCVHPEAVIEICDVLHAQIIKM